MKRFALLVFLCLSGALLAGCSSSAGNSESVPVPVYDVAEPHYDTTANGLNASSADTVAVAKENDVFTFEDGRFTNNAGGYSLSVPDGFSVVDMGDATYRSTLANDDGSMRMDIFTQNLDNGVGDVNADIYLSYSNQFLENTQEFTTISQDTSTNTNDERTIKRTIFSREPLSKVAHDRNYYALIDIIENNQVYSIQLSADAYIDTSILDTLSQSFETFTPTVEAKDYPRFTRTRDDLTDETRDVLNTYFSDDASLSWGVFDPSAGAQSIDRLLELQDKLDHRFTFALCYSDLYKDYKTNIIYDTLTNLYNNGSIVELTLQPVGYDPATNQNIVYDILNGQYDDFLHAYAADVARFGHPVLFRPFNEMNGDWCTYSAYWAGRDTNTYVELYRYVYNIFEEEGANKNTLWIWNANEKSFPDFAWNAIDNYYPGDEYVDIVGLTGYNTGDYYDGETWRSFKDIYDPIMDKMASQYKQPFMITEFASASHGGDKAAWVEDMFDSIQDYPRIKVAIWWNNADYDTDGTIARDYFIDDDPAVLEVFKEHLADSK